MHTRPKSLFRYRTLSAYSLAELVNGTMWFAKPTTFNDPFDCALTIDQQKFAESMQHAINAGMARGLIPKDLPESRRAPTEEERALYLAIREKLRSVAAHLGLCCFSENSRSILMWAHYANNHRGYCVEYSLADETMLAQEVSPVIYSSTMPSLSIADLAPENSGKTVEMLWRTKAACWRYEKEWRALAPEGNRSYPARAPILSVTFGERMPEGDRTLIQQALRGQSGIQLKEAYIHESRFSIRTRKLRGG